MFLQVMNQEEREKFLELVYKVAYIDGEYAQEEQEIIDSYKKELELDTIRDTGSMEELVMFFAAKSDSLKKIVLFETIGLVNADDKIEKAESEVLSLINEKFQIADADVERIENIAKKLQAVYDEIYDILFE